MMRKFELFLMRWVIAAPVILPAFIINAMIREAFGVDIWKWSKTCALSRKLGRYFQGL